MTESDLVFVTGSIRSGTTLLTRLLAAAVSTDPMLQPVPLMLVRLKAEFLKQNKAPDWHVKYPLADDVFGTSFDQNAFTRFVREYPIDKDKALSWLRTDRSYSGVMSEPERGVARLENWSGDTLSDFLCEYLISPSNRSQPIIWKEVFAESYLPFLIECGIPSAIIIRDPRDVVLSQSAGSATDYVGTVRPLLYQVRQWRKSVAWALWLEDQAGGSMVCFEDLVQNPEATLKRTTEKLEIAPPPSKSTIELNPGSNSSFESRSVIDTSTVGRHESLLDYRVAQFIEAACFPEMRYLGYQSDLTEGEAIKTLRNFDVDRQPIRPELKRYQYGPMRYLEELDRLRSLIQKRADFNSVIHITHEAFTKLRS